MKLESFVDLLDGATKPDGLDGVLVDGWKSAKHFWLKTLCARTPHRFDLAQPVTVRFNAVEAPSIVRENGSQEPRALPRLSQPTEGTEEDEL